MIHQIVLSRVPATNHFRCEGAADSGVTNGYILQEMLEGAKLDIIENGLTVGDDIFDQDPDPTVERQLRICYDTEQEIVACESIGPGRLTKFEALGILGYAPIEMEKIARNNKHAARLIEKSVLGPDGRTARGHG